MERLVFLGFNYREQPFAILKVIGMDGDGNFIGTTVHQFDSNRYNNWKITRDDNDNELWNENRFYRGECTSLMLELL